MKEEEKGSVRNKFRERPFRKHLTKEGRRHHDAAVDNYSRLLTLQGAAEATSRRVPPRPSLDDYDR